MLFGFHGSVKIPDGLYALRERGQAPALQITVMHALG